MCTLRSQALPTLDLAVHSSTALAGTMLAGTFVTGALLVRVSVAGTSLVGAWLDGWHAWGGALGAGPWRPALSALRSTRARRIAAPNFQTVSCCVPSRVPCLQTCAGVT